LKHRGPNSRRVGEGTMATDLRLTTAERKALLRCYRRHSDPAVRLRAHIILLLGDGHPWSFITAALFTSASTIDCWRQRYEVEGVEGLLGRPRGAPSRWSDEAGAILRDALEHTPDYFGYLAVNWTVSLLLEHLEKKWGTKPSDLQVRQQLRALDYVWKRPRHALRDSKSPRVKRRLRAIRKKVASLPAGCVKLFEDETDLLLFPPLRAGWFLRGKPAEVPISGENAKRTVFGAINIETGHRIFLSRASACAVDYQAVLPLIREEYKRKRVVVLLDGASRHTAEGSTDLAAELGIEQIPLPPRCANVNPMDRLWRWGKEKICANKQHACIDEQAKRFIEYLLSLSSQEALRKAGLLSGNFWLFRKARVASGGRSVSP
jgi:transposase